MHEPEEIDSETLTKEDLDKIDFTPGLESYKGGSLEGSIELIKGQGIVECYRKWIGKSEPKPGNRTESIMVSCPLPNHPDKNPSAWLNSEKGLWFCGACQIGGDVIDLAALGLGFEVETYKKDPKSFITVLEKALESFGIDPEMIRAQNDVDPGPRASTPDPGTTLIPSEDSAAASPETTVVPNASLAEWVLDEAIPLDWKSIVKDAPGSFLDVWMEATQESPIPDDYLFWLGLQMVGLAVGRDCYITSLTPVYPNLLLALLGDTGSGKSRAVSIASSVLQEALPFDPSDPSNKGVVKLERPGSGEALYEMFSWVPDGEIEHHPVRGLMEVDELQELMGAASRKGSTLREAMISIADNPKSLSHRTRGSGVVEVVEPFLAVATGGQPDAMARIFTRNDLSAGFTNRFIFVNQIPKPREKWLQRQSLDMTGLSDQLTVIRSWASQHALGSEKGEVDIEDIAAEEFDSLLEWIDQLRERPDGDSYARLELHALKLIVILCANKRTDLADESIINSVKLLIENIVPPTETVSQAISVTPDEYYRESVIRIINNARDKNEKPPSQSDINRRVTAKRRNLHKIGEALKSLERSYVVECRTFTDAPGRPIQRWFFANEARWWENE